MPHAFTMQSAFFGPHKVAPTFVLKQKHKILNTLYPSLNLRGKIDGFL